MASKDEQEELRADLGARVPGLEQLAEIPGVVPQSEERIPGPGDAGYEAVFGEDAPRPVLRREFWLAVLFFLVVAAIPLRRGLASPQRVVFGLDRAISSLPWSAVVADEVAAGNLEASDVALKNGGLSDQAVNFYPFYRWVAKSYLDGDSPRWNPLIYCGAPADANPQSGVFDPQVWLLVAGEAIAGLSGFHYAMTLAALGRLFLAGFGAFLLARRLGLGGRGALLAGLTFQFSGYMVLWLNFPLGHVPPLLPWLLYFIEGLLGTGPGETSPWPRRRAFVGAALAMLLAILGGHPETSFFVGLTAGLWCLAVLLRDRAAGLLGLGALALGSLAAAPMLLAFWSYLSVSGAQAIRSAHQESVSVAWSSLFVIVLGLALLRFVRMALVGVPDELTEGSAPPRPLARWTPYLALVATPILFAGGLAWFLSSGLEQRFFLTFVHDLFGQPGHGGYLGPGTSLLETGSTFLVTAALVASLASLFGRTVKLERRGLIAGLGAVSFALAIGLPGCVELYRQLPVIGLGDTVRFAPVAVLMIGLLAGEGLEHAGLRERLAAVLGVGAMLALGLVLFQTAPARIPHVITADNVMPERDHSYGILREPAERLDARREFFEGWFLPSTGAIGARLSLVRRGAEAGILERIDLPLDRMPRPGTKAGQAAPAGAIFFRASAFQTSRLTEGWWTPYFELLGPAGDALLSENQGPRLHLFEPAPRPLTLLLVGLGALAFLFGRRGAPLVITLALAQALTFAEGQNPDYPAAAVFPETKTEQVLARELGFHRFFAEPGVMLPDTGLVRGLAALDGYDAIDPLSYNQTRSFALRPGVHPLLGWSARGADLNSPVFQMLGAGCLVLRSPLGDEPGAERWQLIASPDPAANVQPAETWIYKATGPWPRGWCLTSAITPDVAEANLAAWNPRTTGILLEPWTPDQAATETRAELTARTNNSVAVAVETNGDCLLVISDQYFEGAHFEVDGERREAVAINGLFIGVELHAGDTDVVLVR